jgi:hypothetical protein
MKINKSESKKKKVLSKKKNQIEPLKNFSKVLITEKNYLNTSQKNFSNTPRIKLGQR